MTVQERDLSFDFEGSRLACGAAVPDDPKGIVVLLHGIPSIAPPELGDLGYPGLAREFADEGWLAFWGDMRAVRASEGFFSIEGWVRDATAFVEAARSIEEGRGLPLAMVGSSAGGAVSAEVTARGAPVDALALLAAPAVWLSFAGDPAAGLQRIMFDAGMAIAPEVSDDPTAWAAEFDDVTALTSLPRVNVPVLIVHGTGDIVVPVEHAHMLQGAAPDALVEILEDAPHQLRRDPEAVQVVLDWLDKVLL